MEPVPNTIVCAASAYHVYVIVPPPVPVAVTDPLEPPQVAEVELVLNVNVGPEATVVVAVPVQPFASVTVTV